MPKKLLFIVIDALASRVVNPAIAAGELPTLAALVERGQHLQESTAVFPSITPAATASLITGEYPAAHGIAGAYWYDEQNDEVAYYSNDFWVILREGFDKFLEDFLVRLNEERLRKPTLFEMAEAADLRAGCVNYLWFRGRREHELHVPLLLRLLGRSPKRRSIVGPDILCLGDFAAAVARDGGALSLAGAGLFNRYGFEDETTADYLLDLARQDELPDMTVAYFPDNDYASHADGPRDALQAVKHVDQRLAELFDACGGIDAFLEHTAVVLTGDHSQADMLDPSEDSSAGIDLSEVLADFALADAGKPWSDGDELMACPNLRAAQIYFHGSRPHALRERVVEALLADRRIDQVIARDADDHGVLHVYTADRGRLRFGYELATGTSARDDYGTSWQIDGDTSAIDARVHGGRIEYGQYPNALERLANAFSDKSGSVWVTARPGYAFKLPEVSIHPGGSHGSLHALDSLSPVVVAGAPQSLRIDKPFRSVDCVPLCLSILDVPAPRTIGAAHHAPMNRPAASHTSP